MDTKKLLAAIEKYKRPENATSLAYGTAGFRALGDTLDYVLFRVGLVSSLKCTLLSKTMGVMITASHNPAQDNGVKIIEPDGGMLSADWEQVVEKIVNTKNDKLLDEVLSIVDEFKIDLTKKATIFIGRDTRESGPKLQECLEAGIVAIAPNCNHRSFGLITTPIIHYLVAESNQNLGNNQIQIEAYYQRFISAFTKAIDHYDLRSNKLRLNYNPNLVVDCANGVGYTSIMRLIKELSSHTSHLNLSSINGGEGLLNYECGADHLKTKVIAPTSAVHKNMRYASLDGDADRLVYFYLTSDQQTIELIDGDKIACLFALYLKSLLEESKLYENLTMAIIQTAYANGASTTYIKDKLGLRVDCVDTGVKNLIKQAQNYDVAIYFEANGHGTVHFSNKARQSMLDSNSERLKLVDLMINPYIGDAFSDILLVETILRQCDWTTEKWAALYTDRPNILTKLEISDKSLIQTKDAGTRCTTPLGLQESIDNVVSQFGSSSRCFVRPSGTESVVRIYAEADTLEAARKMAAIVGEKVKLFTHS